MEWINYSPILVMTILRLFLPIGITLFVAWLLKRLDARWKEDAMMDMVSLGPAGMTLANMRCWDVHDCSLERRRGCPAFLNKGQECWETFSVDGKVQESCARCRFRKAKLAAIVA